MWLEKHGIPYRNPCLIEDKAAVSANLYLEDTEKNTQAIQDVGRDVICFSISTNRSFDAKLRAENSSDAQVIISRNFKEWQVLNPDAGIGPGKPNLVEGNKKI
jgi:hypothetical protein